MTESPVKWACEYCTYENWPSAIKCTMCRAQRPSAAIIDEELNEFKRNSIHGDDSGTSSLIICPDSSARPRVRPLRPSEPGSHASVLHPNVVYNDKNHLHAPRWSCAMCTYENWAETRSCAVCEHPWPNDASPVISNEQEQGGWRTRRTRMSPPISSDRDADVHIRDIEVGAHGCDEDFKKLKQIKNRMRKSDWRFLNACVGEWTHTTHTHTNTHTQHTREQPNMPVDLKKKCNEISSPQSVVWGPLWVCGVARGSVIFNIFIQ